MSEQNRNLPPQGEGIPTPSPRHSKVRELSNRTVDRVIDYVSRVGNNYVERNSRMDNDNSLTSMLDRVDDLVIQRLEPTDCLITPMGELELAVFAADHLETLPEAVETLVSLSFINENTGVEDYSPKEAFLLNEVRERSRIALFMRVQEDFLEAEEALIKVGKRTRLTYSDAELEIVSQGGMLPYRRNDEIAAALVLGPVEFEGNVALQFSSEKERQDFNEQVFLNYAFEKLDAEKQKQVKEKISFKSAAIRVATWASFIALSLAGTGLFVKNEIERKYPNAVVQIDQQAANDLLAASSSIVDPRAVQREVVQLNRSAILNDTGFNFEAVGVDTHAPAISSSEVLSTTATVIEPKDSKGAPGAVVVNEAGITAQFPDGKGNMVTVDPIPNAPADVVLVQKIPIQGGEDGIYTPDFSQGGVSVQDVTPADLRMTSFGVPANKVIDMVLYYTTQAAQKNPNIRNSLIASITRMNQVFVDSGVVAYIRLLDVRPVPGDAPINETQMDAQTAVDVFAHSAVVDADMNQLSGDVAGVVTTEVLGGFCGYTAQNTPNTDQKAMDTAMKFQVTDSCAETNGSLLHEGIGHLGFLNHDPANAPSAAELPPIDPRAYGFVDTPAMVRSIMAYASSAGEARQMLFSNSFHKLNGRDFFNAQSDESAVLNQWGIAEIANNRPAKNLPIVSEQTDRRRIYLPFITSEILARPLAWLRNPWMN